MSNQESQHLKKKPLPVASTLLRKTLYYTIHFIHLIETEKVRGKVLQWMLVSTSEQLYWGHKTSEEHPGLALGITTTELRKKELFHLWLFLVFRLIHSTFSFLSLFFWAGWSFSNREITTSLCPEALWKPLGSLPAMTQSSCWEC